MMLPLMMGSLSLSQTPIIKEHTSIKIGDIKDTTIFHSKGGTHTYRWDCPEGEYLYWELHTPNNHAPPITVEIYNHGQETGPTEHMTFTGEISEAAPNPTLHLQACPFFTHDDAHMTMAYRLVAQYGRTLCASTQVHHVTVTSTGPTSFKIGYNNHHLLAHYFSATYYYLTIGGWAGLICPGATFLVFAMFLMSSNLISHYAQGAPHSKQPTHYPFMLVEMLLATSWLVSILYDTHRYFQMPRSDDCMPDHIQALGPVKAPTTSGINETTGLLILRLAISATAVWLIFWAALIPSTKDRIMVIVSSWLAAIAIFVACMMLGSGYGLGPVSILAWVVYQSYTRVTTTSSSKQKKKHKGKTYSPLKATKF